MKKYIKDLFSKGQSTRGVGYRSALLLVVLACVLGAPFRAQAYYQNMGTDRILLMNDDLRSEAQGRVENQGYYCTNHTAGTTYWKHEPIGDNSSLSTRYMLHGTEHVFYSPDGHALWRLKDCRAGYIQTSGTAIKNRIWLPWSKTAQKSGTSDYKATVDGKTVTSYTNEPNSTVIMRNTLEAKVYSPFYHDGIGTLYFDAVNSFTAADKGSIAIQISTNLTMDAQTMGEVSFEEVDQKVDFSKWDDYYEWKTIPLTVLEVKGSGVTTKQEGTEADTNLVMSVSEQGATHYYRLRTQLNYYGPIRFRICRTAVDEGSNPDTSGLILIDNIVASYPPTTVKFDRVGDDYDPSLSGTSVLGCVGDFNKPFVTYADSSVNGQVHFSWVTNFQNTTQNLTLSKPFLNYRWRYMDQKVNPWKTVVMTTNENVTAQATVRFQTASSCTQLVTVAGVPLSDGVGDLEYFYTATFSGPYYLPRDYANDTAVGFGLLPGSSKPWTEAITSISNRLDIAPDLYTPARGKDYFTRIREGLSDYKWVALCTSLTTNGTEEVVKQDIRMELVGDHTWRTHYYVPTNRVGERLSFHFQGEEIFTNAWVSGYHHRTNTWYCDIAELPYIPYTSAAGLGYHRDISCVLDGVGTHLLIEFNDELLSFSISHATYQNFNAWTDATSGYVGHTNWNGEGAVGVSDAKQKYVLEMTKDNGWEGSIFTKDYWYEAFDSNDHVTYPLNKRFDEHRTPNGWTAGHGIFIPTQRSQADESMGLQIEGRGQGWIAMDSFSDDMMPKGVDKVSFRARVAQEPRFEDFAWYMDGIAMTNYAICARLSMGHLYDKLFNPTDISPGNPSVSLVAYYRPTVGCYEFRITRSEQDWFAACIYKWVPDVLGMKATLLASNAVQIATIGTVQGFGNYLVPNSTSDANANGSRAYLLVNKVGSTVHLVGALSTTRGTAMLSSDNANVKQLVKATDSNKILQKGSYGVGSTDCAATFYGLSIHRPTGAETIETAGQLLDDTFTSGGDWAYFQNRWAADNNLVANSKANLKAVMPENQTIRLEFKLPNSGDGWQESGYEQVITSFSTNKYEFLPRVSQSYQVRLRTGGNTWDDVRTDLAVDEIRVTSWQAENYPDLAYYNGQSFNWVYMQGVVTNFGGKTALSLQPSRAIPGKAQGLRSPFLANGLSMFSFDYVNATVNTKLLLQICTNLTAVGSVSESLTTYPPENYNWTTVDTWDFSTGKYPLSGSLTHYMSLRAPIKGLIRLVTDKSVIEKCIAEEGKATRNVNYGQIIITGAYCYDEPALDLRSWYAWNFHTAGWNTEDKRFGYLFDSPDGLSGSLNFSALDSDNMTADAWGIGLADRGDIEAYKANNSFVQCPPLTNGIGSVSFRARTFDTNATHKAAWVTLYGSYEPDDDQLVSPESWKRIYDFKITNTTYQTYQWKTTDDSSQYRAIRLEMAGSHTGRNPSTGASTPEWDRPKETPLQRVFLDEISVGEPIQPRIVFRNVRPFRTGVVDIPPCVVSNVTDLSEQPLFGESWGLQCTIEPQQMGDDLDEESIKVYAAFKRGVLPWGYESWSNEVRAVQLDHVPGTLTFRSSYNIPESIISPVDTPTSTYPDNVWQYYIWCEFSDKAGNKHRHSLDSVDWSVPSWYNGIQDLNETYRSQGFAGYTILDTISPKRAWINEVNLCDTGMFDNSDGARQFIEIAAPRGADLTAWSINILGSGLKRGTIATYGFANAKLNPNPKMGRQLGVDWTNNYTVVALRSPEAAQAGQVAGADGTWDALDSDTCNLLQMSGKSSMYYYETYGIELVRPSGVIEHQVVVQGTNVYAGTEWEGYGSGTNLLAKLLAADGRTAEWFFAGADESTGTLGVFKSHGENEFCWTNTLVATAGELNKFDDGTRQLIDPTWFLQPNGTNVWIYATVLGDHIHQAIGSKTNNSEVFIIKKGTSTNIVYTADKWWALGDVTTNEVKVADAEGRADRADNHKWTLTLKDVTETVTVYADEKAGAEVTGVGVDKTDPYFPAIMDWLADKDDENGLYLAQFVPLHGNMAYAHDLGLKEMYWLDIDPTKPGWVLRAGMGGKGSSSSNPVQPIYLEEFGRTYTNSRVVVTMMITNTVTHTVRPPDHLLGLEPGSNSYNYDYGSPAWTSVTFKICGALQRSDVTNVSSNYYPLRWFVFTKNSFDENFQTTIDLWDPRSQNSPGWFYGWGDYPGVPIWYRWRLDGDPAWYDTAEPLNSKSTYSE